MSDQVTIGDYSLEISGDEVLVRDESGAIVESVDRDKIDGELTLPDGQRVDLALVLAGQGVDGFETGAGPTNDNAGGVNGSPTQFRHFQDDHSDLNGEEAADTLDATTLVRATLDGTPPSQTNEPNQLSAASFDWSRHDPWQPDQTLPNGSGGNSDSGNGQNQSGETGVDESEDQVAPPTDERQPDDEEPDQDPITPPADDQQQPGDEEPDQDPAPLPGEEQQQPEEAANAAPTDIELGGSSVVENVAGAIVGALTVVDPDAGDTHTFALSDDR
ncbi:MAG: hypothetical protein ACREEP_13235, partial [Dongiaceae bacterium]